MRGFELAPRLQSRPSDVAISYATPSDLWGAVHVQERLGELGKTSTLLMPVAELAENRRRLGLENPEDPRRLRVQTLREVGAQALIIVSRYYDELDLSDEGEINIENPSPEVAADLAALRYVQEEYGGYKDGAYRVLTTLPVSAAKGPQIGRPRQTKLQLVRSPGGELAEILKTQEKYDEHSNEN